MQGTNSAVVPAAVTLLSDPVTQIPGFCGEIRYAFCTRRTHTNQTEGIAALTIKPIALPARTGGRGMDGKDGEKQTGENRELHSQRTSRHDRSLQSCFRQIQGDFSVEIEGLDCRHGCRVLKPQGLCTAQPTKPYPGQSSLFLALARQTENRSQCCAKSKITISAGALLRRISCLKAMHPGSSVWCRAVADSPNSGPDSKHHTAHTADQIATPSQSVDSLYPWRWRDTPGKRVCSYRLVLRADEILVSHPFFFFFKPVRSRSVAVQQ